MQMVELASKKFVCIVDESKLVEGLGGSKGNQQRVTCMGASFCSHAARCVLLWQHIMTCMDASVSIPCCT